VSSRIGIRNGIKAYQELANHQQLGTIVLICDDTLLEQEKQKGLVKEY